MFSADFDKERCACSYCPADNAHCRGADGAGPHSSAPLIEFLQHFFLRVEMTSTTPTHPAFIWRRSARIESLDLEFTEYEHRVTGARHIHLAADNPENVFLVAFRTMPMNSTGVAHVLEHTVLCGSERFPVRDPFFMMIRRSLNTFMNAFTSSDWTAYPFATQNRSDYFNLLSVYLDATFFATLNPLDFAQEGIRLELASPQKPEGELVYKGVVFNEMKGALSSPASVLWETVNKHLFPTTTYHFNSGGDPVCIPDLSYPDLLAFYKKHYHPSNALFLTFGDIPAEQLQERFESLALHRFDALESEVRGRDEKRYLAPVRVEEAYPLDEETEEAHTHVVLAWLMGHTSTLEDRLEAALLCGVLLDNSSSPLRHALETVDYANAPSPLCGIDDNNREISFIAGVEGTEVAHAADVEQLILTVLRTVAEEGVPLAQVEAVLHQLELSQREIGGDRYPYGLSLLLQVLTPALQDADPLPVLDLEPVLKDMRQKIQESDYIPSLVKKWLLDNPHQVRVTLRPDRELSQRAMAAEKADLARRRAALSTEELQNILQDTEQLALRQQQKDDPEVLPRVGREDIPADLKEVRGQCQHLPAEAGHVPVTEFAQGTNGLVYQQIVLDMPQLPESLESWLPFYTYALAELGAGPHDYRLQQHRQAAVSGGLSMGLTTRTSLDSAGLGQGHLVFSGKALMRHHAEFSELMKEQLQSVRFDELEHLQDLFLQLRNRWENSITGSGHSLAMQAACSRMSAVSAWNYRLYGMNGIRFVRRAAEALNDPAARKQLAQALSDIHERVLGSPRQMLLIAERENLVDCMADIGRAWQGFSTSPQQDGFSPVSASGQEQVAWVANTQVHFCARAYPAVPIDHVDAAPLMILGGFLRNGFLHRSIREQGGAYGGGAGYDSNACAFRFYSYRDPRFEDTLTDFDHALDWMLSSSHEERQLEEALLGIISDMDKPLSPSGEAKQAFHNQLYGRTLEQRRRLRQRLLSVTLADLERVTRHYLHPQHASTAVIIPAAAESRALRLGLSVERL